jgi:DNA-binding NarL/FixJ family response regulator
MTIRVAIVDDQDLVRAGFRALISSSSMFEVVGEAADGEQAVELARSENPDVILMDIRMPEMDGLEATRAITSSDGLENVRIIILTTFDLDEYVHDALRAGASGFLLKDTSPGELLHAIEVVAAGDALLAPAITKRLIENFAGRPPVKEPPSLDALTEREREVLVLVGQGLSNQEIAAQLSISPATAKTHVSRILMKVGDRDRAQLVVTAYETGLITPKR